MPTIKHIRPPWLPKPKKQESQSTTDFDYNTHRWRKDRRLFLKQEQNLLCVECKKQGRTTPATVSDHIVPISQGGDPWSWDNRQALCERCHNRKRQSERK